VSEAEPSAEAIIEQVDIGGQGEARVAMPEPALHLLDVPTAGEQERGAGVAEGVEADTRDARLLRRRR
jgi:hypothetical protein